MKNRFLFFLAGSLLAVAGCATPPTAKISPAPLPVAPVPELASLNLYWDGRDNYTTCGDDAKKDGYNFVRVEGFVFAQPQSGTVPLKQYWSARRHDHWLLTGNTPHGTYKFVRIEGYVYPNAQPGTVPL